LSANPNAIELLKINPKKIDWEYASMNPAIFEVNKL
jgi:thiamine kinase-like enzyme